MKQKDIVILLFSSFILTVIWIGFSLYSSAVTSTITETQGMQIQEIAPDFDPEAISSIKNRTVVEPLFESQAVLNDLSPTPSVETEVADESEPIIFPDEQIETLPEDEIESDIGEQPVEPTASEEVIFP